MKEFEKREKHYTDLNKAFIDSGSGKTENGFFYNGPKVKEIFEMDGHNKGNFEKCKCKYEH